MNKFLNKINEVASIVIAFLLWVASAPLLRRFDPTMGDPGLGVLRDLLYTFMAGLAIHGVSWILIRISWPELYEFKNEFVDSLLCKDKSTQCELGQWQKSVLLLWVFSLYFVGFIVLHRIVAGLV